MAHPHRVPTLDDVSADLSHLSHLLTVANRLLTQADVFVLPSGERNTEMDDIAGLVSIAEEMAARIHEDLDPMTVSYAPKDPGTGA